MQTIPYLLFNGNCEEAFKFYERALGAKIECVLTHEGTPAEAHVAPEFRKKVLHGRINVDGQPIMASDCPPERYNKPQGFSVNLTVQDAGQAERLYRALEDGGHVSMPMQETLLGHPVRYGDRPVRHSVDGQLREGAPGYDPDGRLHSGGALGGKRTWIHAGGKTTGANRTREGRDAKDNAISVVRH